MDPEDDRSSIDQVNRVDNNLNQDSRQDYREANDLLVGGQDSTARLDSIAQLDSTARQGSTARQDSTGRQDFSNQVNARQNSIPQSVSSFRQGSHSQSISSPRRGDSTHQNSQRSITSQERVVKNVLLSENAEKQESSRISSQVTSSPKTSEHHRRPSTLEAVLQVAKQPLEVTVREAAATTTQGKPNHQIELPLSSEPVKSIPPQARDAPCPNPQGTLTLEDFRRVIKTLESRIAICESVFGDPSEIAGARAEAKAAAKTEAGESDEFFDQGFSAARKEWEDELDHAVEPQMPAIVQTDKVLRLVDSILDSQLNEFTKKLDKLEGWLDGGTASAEQLLNVYTVQRACLLAHEEELKERAAQLRVLEELKNYTNPSSFAELAKQKKRIIKLSTNGLLLASRVSELTKKVEQLACIYLDAMGQLGTPLGQTNNIPNEQAAE